MSSDKKLLADYSKSIGMVGSMTVAQLIDSHKRLREMAIETNEARRDTLQKAWDYGAKMAQEQAISYGWFSRERLRAMSIGELADVLNEVESDG